MKKIKLFLLTLFVVSITNAQITSHKLNNGLTVVYDIDTTETKVFGFVGVNAGSNDEDPNATGIAHYLEHMLFKGTENFSTSNWEKEKPIIDEIYKQYDLMQKASSQEEINAINKKINKLSQESSKYVITNELSKVIQQMGGYGMNATTSFDYTNYFNYFPSNQLEKWIRLYAHRFEKPVFRLFQTELETVYEEKNRAEDNPGSAYGKVFLKNAFEGHPYSRPIIGHTEHLKKPWMSKMNEFFKTWYVPNNMILILSGNFDAEKASKVINETFGKWESKPLPKRNNPKLKPFKGKQTVRVKVTDYLMGDHFYRGPVKSFRERLIFMVISNLLSNSASTGLLDKIMLDGDAMFVNANFVGFKNATGLDISYAPVYDANQRRQLSFKDVENRIESVLNTLKKGTYNYWLLNQVKENLINDIKLSKERLAGRALSIFNSFIIGDKLNRLESIEQEISKVTKEDIAELTAKYLGDNFLAIYSHKGEAKKEKITKPKIDPIKPLEHKPSEFARELAKIIPEEATPKFVDFGKDMAMKVFQDKVNLYHVANKKNDVFSMIIKFHSGLNNIPKLKYAVQLMNNAGVMGEYKPEDLKREIGKLGIRYRFVVDEDYTSLFVSGNESKLAEACQLISKLMLIPGIEDKALDRIIGMEYSNRVFEGKRVASQSRALLEHIVHGDKSKYKNRETIRKLATIRPSELTAVFNKATSSNADIHYYGTYSLGQALYILKKNLAFAANREIVNSPSRRKQVDYKKDKIFYLRNGKTSQNRIVFYKKGITIPKDKRYLADAFNQYFSGGFNGILVKEIRENRALAYSTNATIETPQKNEWKSGLYGFVGTQTDKTEEATELVYGLLKDVPEYKDRIFSIKDYLVNKSYTSLPHPRYLSQTIYNWALAGYKTDPYKSKLGQYKNLSFEKMMSFYKDNYKNQPLIIGIIGNINSKTKNTLRKIGSFKEIKNSDVFSEKK